MRNLRKGRKDPSTTSTTTVLYPSLKICKPVNVNGAKKYNLPIRKMGGVAQRLCI